MKIKSGVLTSKRVFLIYENAECWMLWHFNVEKNIKICQELSICQTRSLRSRHLYTFFSVFKRVRDSENTRAGNYGACYAGYQACVIYEHQRNTTFSAYYLKYIYHISGHFKYSSIKNHSISVLMNKHEYFARWHLPIGTTSIKSTLTGLSTIVIQLQRNSYWLYCPSIFIVISCQCHCFAFGFSDGL